MGLIMCKMCTSRWRPDALFQCRCSGIGIMHRDATGGDALLPSFYANYSSLHGLHTKLHYIFVSLNALALVRQCL